MSTDSKVTAVADTGPINYLVRIGAIDILPKIYGTVLLPTAVAQELNAPNSLPMVREWTATLPDWVSPVEVQNANDMIALIHL